MDQTGTVQTPSIALVNLAILLAAVMQAVKARGFGVTMGNLGGKIGDRKISVHIAVEAVMRAEGKAGPTERVTVEQAAAWLKANMPTIPVVPYTTNDGKTLYYVGGAPLYQSARDAGVELTTTAGLAISFTPSTERTTRTNTQTPAPNAGI